MLVLKGSHHAENKVPFILGVFHISSLKSASRMCISFMTYLASHNQRILMSLQSHVKFDTYYILTFDKGIPEVCTSLVQLMSTIDILHG